MSTDLATPATTMLAAPAPSSGLTVRGRGTESQPTVSRLSLYHGTAEEEAAYGRHERGSFLDTLECRSLGKTVKVAPITAFATYAMWQEGQRMPVQSWDDRTKVPPHLLEWQDVGDKRIKPQVTEAINVVFAVEGEPWPYLFVFKRTGIKAFSRQVEPIEARRGIQGKGPGMFELGSVDDKSASGQPYKRLTAKFAGDPTEDMAAIIVKVRQAEEAFHKLARERAAEDQNESGGDAD